MKVATTVVAAAIVLGLWGAAPSRGDEAIDWNKAQQLHRRERLGEKLSAEEQAYLDRAKAERTRGGSEQGRAPSTEGGKESVGLAPLTELKDKYKGQDGGLYGGGSNEPPATHLKLALAAAAKIRPLDDQGKPSENGKIVLLSIGMSNTTQEFSTFQRHAAGDAQKNPKLVIVDGAQGGMDAAMWADETKRERPWRQADQRLAASNVTPQQVQVAWIKQARAGPGRIGEFPKSSDALRDDVAVIVQLAKEHYPNLQLAYLSSRIYAGYASGPLNPEPYAYEGAIAVRGVIQLQMKGEAALNADPSKGAVKAPVVLWGPYLWADGTKGRQADDLVWKREDLANDGTHPSPSGREKVAQLLLKFFKNDATAKGWFLKGQ